MTSATGTFAFLARYQVFSHGPSFIGGPICRIHQSASRIHGATGQDTGDGPHVECVACWYKARQQGGLGTLKNVMMVINPLVVLLNGDPYNKPYVVVYLGPGC